MDEDGAAVSIQTGVSELVKILIVVILLITDQEELCFRQEKISFGSFWANNPNQCNIQLLERFIFQTMKTTSQNSFSEGLAQNWRSDLLSGFMVFLLALPLSLGIAKASGFPAAMGVLTAMVGGLVTSFFRVAPLAIKGPAAGLITICSGAFLEFGGEQAWPMVTAAVMVAGALQIFLAGARWGSLSDFFPATVVHGMLSSIGMIIIAKQFPVLMGVDPASYQGLSPLELLVNFPVFGTNCKIHLAVMGLISALIMFLHPLLAKGWIRKLPAPMWVLLFAVPASVLLNFSATQPAYAMVSIGNFWGQFGFHFDFGLIGQFVFWKYVFLFLFVNTLESMLTVKAIDPMDPYHRKADDNGDLMGLGFGNLVSASLGGLPMISEVVRSSSNVAYGARTKWSNFFHGVFLLIAMIFLIPLIEKIPNTALAAVLIYAGWRLTSPKHYIQIYQIGPEQLAIFLVTVVVTLVGDLLLGIAAGIVLKFVLHWIRGVQWNQFFKADGRFESASGVFYIKGPAIFSNLLSFKKQINKHQHVAPLVLDFGDCSFVDHTFLEFIYRLKRERNQVSKPLHIQNLEQMQAVSGYKTSARRRFKNQNS